MGDDNEAARGYLGTGGEEARDRWLMGDVGGGEDGVVVGDGGADGAYSETSGERVRDG